MRTRGTHSLSGDLKPLVLVPSVLEIHILLGFAICLYIYIYISFYGGETLKHFLRLRCFARQSAILLVPRLGCADLTSASKAGSLDHGASERHKIHVPSRLQHHPFRSSTIGTFIAESSDISLLQLFLWLQSS